MLLRLQFEDREGRVVLAGQNVIPEPTNQLDIQLIVKVIRGGRCYRTRISTMRRLPFHVERRPIFHLQDNWSLSDDDSWTDLSDDSDNDRNGQQNGAQLNGGGAENGGNEENGAQLNGGGAENGGNEENGGFFMDE
jgi:hypothetical protein